MAEKTEVSIPIDDYIEKEEIDTESEKISLIDEPNFRFSENEGLPQHPVSKALKNDKLRYGLYIFLFIGLIVYTISTLAVDFQQGLPVLYLELFVLVCVGAMLLSRIERLQDFFISIEGKFLEMDSSTVKRIYLAIMISILILGFIFSRNDLSQLFGFIGVTAIIMLCYLFSWNRRAVKWRPVVWGFALQFTFGILILKTKPGEQVFKFFGDQIAVLQKYTDEGVDFVFAPLNIEQPFALSVLPVIILYSGLTSVLFHWGILQKITQAVGQTMIFTMGTSAPESLNAAGNIFLGQTESPLLIKPYLKSMTNSEIHAVMTGGFATIAGGVLVAFTLNGIPAEHLLSASVMSAPAALAISKIVYPETIKVDDSNIKSIPIGEKCENALEAFSKGASVSIPLIANIVANLVAFLALIAFLNEIVSYFMTKIGFDDVNFEQLVGYIFAPFAFLMGIPFEDCGVAGELLGIKTVTNEFVAFSALNDSEFDSDGKTFLIMTYALCGFANFSSIGIQLGALGAMAPSKMSTLASLAFSAMICGNLACFMTACVASVLLS